MESTLISEEKPYSIRLKLAQMEVIPGRPDLNFTKIQSWYLENHTDCDIIVFPEMCLSGYLISDLWEDLHFLKDCMSFAQELCDITSDCVLIFGSVYLDENKTGEDGRLRRYNSAMISQNGQWIQNKMISQNHFPKSLMPNYREFDDSRYFYDLRKFAWEESQEWSSLLAPVSLSWNSSVDNSDAEVTKRTLTIAPILCEDSWDNDYSQSPSEVYCKKGAKLLINLSCSPYTHDKFQKRNRLLLDHAKEYQVPVAYVNNVGIQNNGKTLFSFDGRSAFYTPDLEVFAELDAWHEGVESYDFPASAQARAQNQAFSLVGSKLVSAPFEAETIEHKLDAIIYSLKTHMAQSGLKRVVIGASGGVDSCLSAALFAQILAPEDIFLVNMPSQYNSQTTISIAKELAANIGAWYMEVPIEDSVTLTKSQIDGLEIHREGESQVLKLSSFHLENVQARDRSSRILSAIASSVGGVYPSNANKAETMVGYSTLYGDHGGFILPIGDLWKDEVFEMCHLLNHRHHSFSKSTSIIPPKVFEIPPSAELSDKQDVDAGLGDPLIYEYHDKLFHSWIQRWNRSNPSEILLFAIKGELNSFLSLPQPIDNYFSTADEFIEDLERWWRLFKGMGVVKRVQAPTIIALSRRSFGYDYRESIMSVYMGRDYLVLKEKFLSEGQKWFQD